MQTQSNQYDIVSLIFIDIYDVIKIYIYNERKIEMASKVKNRILNNIVRLIFYTISKCYNTWLKTMQCKDNCVISIYKSSLLIQIYKIIQKT